MQLRTVSLGVASWLSTLAVTTSGFAQTPDPSTIGINSFTASGTGCPAGTVSADISEDREAITLAFSNFQVELAGFKTSRQFSKTVSCLVNLDVRVPVGYAMFLNYVDSRGYLALPGKGATSILQLQLGVAGSGNWVDSSRGIWHVNATGWGITRVGMVDFKAKTGPFTGDFAQTTTINPKEFDQASCSRTGKLAFGLKTIMTLRNMEKTESALFTIDTQDGAVVKKFNVKYVKCKA